MHVRGAGGIGGPCLQLGADDLANVKVSPGWGPVTESLFSLRVLRRRQAGGLGEPWRRMVTGQLGPETTLLLAVVPAAPLVDLHTVVGQRRSVQDALKALEAAPVDQMRQELGFLEPPRDDHLVAGARAWLQDLSDGGERARRHLVDVFAAHYESAVDPYWRAISAFLKAEQARCGQVLVEGGLDRLLGALHPRIHWRPPFLDVDVVHTAGRSEPSTALEGRSLVLVPSVFCLDRPYVFRSTADEDHADVLIYPALRNMEDAASLWLQAARPGSAALGRLLGRTKAAALAAIADTCTTTELADRAGVTPPTASHHAAVLRAAGLVRSRRSGKAVLHHLTPMGVELLEGRSSSSGRDGTLSRAATFNTPAVTAAVAVEGSASESSTEGS